jgi:hypothetical protein
MVRTLAALVAALELTTSLAHAQERGLDRQGEFIVSADRLVPLLSYTRVRQNDLPPLPAGVTQASTTTTQTSLSLLWASTPPQEVFFTVPRVGFDYVLVRNVTVGGDVAIYGTLGSHASTKTELDSGQTVSTSVGNDGMFVFGIAPRGGYILRLTGLLAVWLRGGFSFYTSTASSPKAADGTHTHDGVNQFALDIDPQLVITFVRHFGLTAGITSDIPLAGEHSHTTFNPNGSRVEASAGSSIFFIGATAGLLGYF